MAIDTDAGDLGHLDPAIQKVEFKLTVLAGEEGTVEALLQSEGGQPQRRKVYFYDTKDLALYGTFLILIVVAYLQHHNLIHVPTKH